MSLNNDGYCQQPEQIQYQYDWFRQQAGQQPQPWNKTPYTSQNPNVSSPQNRNPGSSPASQALDPSPSPSTASNTANLPWHNEPKDELNNRGRTPSPTPSELRALSTSGAIHWKTILNRRFWIRKQWTWYYVALVVILTITAFIAIYHKQIVLWLTPMTRWLHDSHLNVSWLVPIGVLFVLSFPPLFGHEIVAMLAGLVWGMWIGFGIVAAGTFLGEVGNFYAFRYCCRARGEKLERTKFTYACLAKVVREGGFKIALIARLSAIPGHFTTAVFSTCGMGIVVFSLAAILSMPKQFILVYLGVILEQSGDGSQADSKSGLITGVVLAITLLITFGAMWYIFREMGKVKPQVIYERRKARQAKLNLPFSGSSVSSAPNHGISDTNITLPERAPHITASSETHERMKYTGTLAWSNSES